jgi:hypothetical protein
MPMLRGFTHHGGELAFLAPATQATVAGAAISVRERSMARNPSRRGFALLLAGGLVAAVLSSGLAARAQTPSDNMLSADVGEVLARMNKTLLATDFSFKSDTLRTYVGPNGELLHIAHETKIVVRRPDRLSIDAAGDDGAMKMLYDGKTLVVYGVEQKQYATIPVPDKLQGMVDVAESRFGLDFPLADFMADDPAKSILTGVTSGGQVGTATIGGVACRHFFFNQAPDLEAELWLEDNERALPRRFIVTYKSLPGRPTFVAELSNWNFSARHADSDFVFQPPPGVTQMEVSARPGMPFPAGQ